MGAQLVSVCSIMLNLFSTMLSTFFCILCIPLQRKSTGFAAHMKAKTKSDGKSNSAMSDFSRTKSIREQREYLPVFSVRDTLLQTIRENNM